MKLTKETEYALDGLASLASYPAGTVMPAADLADAVGTSTGFMSKIMQRLSLAKIARGHRGNPRGYSLARLAERISVRAVVEALEGDDIFERCIFWSELCSETTPCSLHDVWKRVRPQVRAQLSERSLRDLARKRRKSR
jgi:Rrf2 family transcriptional regulator, iron-sulfur cluster assembly transcription factor